MKKIRIVGASRNKGFHLSNLHSEGKQMLSENEYDTFMQALRLRQQEDRTLRWGIGMWGVNTWGKKNE